MKYPRTLLKVALAGAIGGSASLASGLTGSSWAPMSSASATTGTSVVTWGANWSGQLGNQCGSSSLVPTSVAVPGVPMAVATGQVRAAALTEAGDVYQWGDDAPVKNHSGTKDKVICDPTLVPLPTGVTAKAIAVGDDWDLALGSNGQLYTWGVNTFGQLGNGTDLSSATPTQVLLPSGVSATTIAAAEEFGLATGSNGLLYSWGDNLVGQLGNGNLPTNSDIPIVVQLPTGVSPRSIAAGGTGSLGFGLALGSDGHIYGWGYNNDGQLPGAVGSQISRPDRLTVPAGVAPKKVAAGRATGYLIGQNGRLFAWGDNTSGQVGDGRRGNTQTDIPPTRVQLPSGVSASSISGGLNDSIAIGSDGAIYAWGANSFGQLGDGSKTLSTLPVQVSTSGAAGLAVSAGWNCGIAVVQGG